MITDWQKEIAVAWYVQEQTERLDRQHIWQYHLPRVGAAEDALKAAETALQHPIDPCYRRFLTFANGWPDFYQSTDLFGTEELVGSPIMDYATRMLAAVDSEAFKELSLKAFELLPIAVAKHDIDLFLIARPFSAHSGKMFWLASGVIDQFSSFDDFFLSMIDYNRIRLQRFQEGRKGDKSNGRD